MKKRILTTLITSLLLGACGYIRPQGMPMNYGSNPSQTSQFTSNGEQIFFTATDDQNGDYISYTGGPFSGGMMMGGNLTCATCHGNDGYGGTHYMHMQTMDAPAINYDALIDMKKEDSGGNPTEYSLDDLRSAVVEGHDTAGKELDQNMPRWQMSDQ
ncbi:MAG TPA: hypothetical protein VJ987_14450, partial [Anaerolineales bacterium]|nr:hypothetical protein [Anaerolineales bacterium]